MPAAVHAREGLPLPEARDWLEYWGEAEIPQVNGFLAFAEHAVDMPPRPGSAPPGLSSQQQYSL
jgi:hypothetical protein